MSELPHKEVLRAGIGPSQICALCVCRPLGISVLPRKEGHGRLEGPLSSSWFMFEGTADLSGALRLRAVIIEDFPLQKSSKEWGSSVYGSTYDQHADVDSNLSK